MSNSTKLGFQIATQLLAMAEPPAIDAADRGWWLPENDPSVNPLTAPVQLQSQYIKTADGTRLAVDVYLPSDATLQNKQETFPAILVQTRYHRRYSFTDWAEPLRNLLDMRLVDAQRYAAEGYVLVVYDQRGSGASFGFRPGELHPIEARDGLDVCQWICAQPWSNEEIVTTGVSYEGSAAEHLTNENHPALRAAIIRYALFDAYTDIIRPGGLRPGWFLSGWGTMITTFDRNEVNNDLPMAGVPPVDADTERTQLSAAVSEHVDNCDHELLIQAVEYRDDLMKDGRSISDMSSWRSAQPDLYGRTPVYNWSGYFDGGYPAAAVHRFHALRQAAPDVGHQLILGPWDHGNSGLSDTSHDQQRVGFDFRTEMLRFFNQSRQTPDENTEKRRVHYYTMNQHQWKHAEQWPPSGFEPHTLYFGENFLLSEQSPGETATTDNYQVDYSATSGMTSRWHSYINTSGALTGYPDRAEQDKKLLVYQSEPLQTDMEVTGHPTVSLRVSVDRPDSAFYVYLEELRPDGQIVYVTEGLLRAIHRKQSAQPPAWHSSTPYHSFMRNDASPLVPGEVVEISFGLLPVSYLFRTGSRIRLACSGADRDNFDRVPEFGAPPVWTVHRSAEHASCLTLPARFDEQTGP